MKTYIFYVSGTHCSSCKIFIEDILNEQIGIEQVNVDLNNKTITVKTNLNKSPNEIADLLTEKIKNNGYYISVQKKDTKNDESRITWQALLIGLIFLALFFVIQKNGILNFGLGSEINPISSFFIGLIASVSSCLAIVGGLVLSLSATVSQNKIKSVSLFHFGRIVSFMIFGGILGFIGGSIGVNFIVSTILGLIASVIMILFGLNLVGLFNKNKISLPVNIFNFFRKIENKMIAPLLVGVGTFFLPCGFTQTMQIVAISSGSFVSGLLIMGMFALGTLPMLSILSFGSVSFTKSKYSNLFSKSAGVIVLGFGIFALLSGLAGIGFIDPLFSI